MRLLLVCLTLAATSALAKDFEGVIIGKPVETVASQGPGLQSLKISLASSGARVEAVGQGGFQYVMVWRADEPDTAYILSPASKTYMKHDISKAQKAAAAADAPTVEKLGKATFLGHPVERVKVTTVGKNTREIWVDTSLHFPAAALTAFGMERNKKNGVWAALDKAGLAGIPLKDLGTDGKSGWEATSVEARSLPTSLFIVPADYREGTPMDMLSPDQQAKIQAHLNSMTPEQRAKYEEMMKKMTQ
jgi:hypothetical protein